MKERAVHATTVKSGSPNVMVARGSQQRNDHQGLPGSLAPPSFSLASTLLTTPLLSYQSPGESVGYVSHKSKDTPSSRYSRIAGSE